MTETWMDFGTLVSSVEEMAHSDAEDTKMEKESQEQAAGHLSHEYSFLLAWKITKELYDVHFITLSGYDKNTALKKKQKRSKRSSDYVYQRHL